MREQIHASRITDLSSSFFCFPSLSCFNTRAFTRRDWVVRIGIASRACNKPLFESRMIGHLFLAMQQLILNFFYHLRKCRNLYQVLQTPQNYLKSQRSIISPFQNPPRLGSTFRCSLASARLTGLSAWLLRDSRAWAFLQRWHIVSLSKWVALRYEGRRGWHFEKERAGWLLELGLYNRGQ